MHYNKKEGYVGGDYAFFFGHFFICWFVLIKEIRIWIINLQQWLTQLESFCKLFPVVSQSVQFSHSVVSNSLQPHELQHTRPPCPSQTPGVYSNSCPSSLWCHPAISSTVVLFSSAPNPSQHQGLLQWVNSSHEVAKVLEFQL